MRWIKRIAIALGVLVVVLAIVFVFRFPVLTQVASWFAPFDLLAAGDEEPEARWFDDYYTIFKIDDRTYAIGETRYWQLNFNYLIIGDERAILFDAGPGIRDIRPVVRSLTDKPLTFVPSHFHYDHVGNGIEFENVAIIDLPFLRERAPDNRLTLTSDEHLGKMERFASPTFTVGEWWKPGQTIDLGNRQIEVVYTPGHTTDGVSLVDVDAGYAFTGDFFCAGTLASFTPTGGMGDYVQGIEALLEVSPPNTVVYGAHRILVGAKKSPERGLPIAHHEDMVALRDALLAIEAGTLKGSGLYPYMYSVNDQIDLWSNPPFMQEWERSHPQ